MHNLSKQQHFLADTKQPAKSETLWKARKKEREREKERKRERERE